MLADPAPQTAITDAYHSLLKETLSRIITEGGFLKLYARAIEKDGENRVAQYKDVGGYAQLIESPSRDLLQNGLLELASLRDGGVTSISYNLQFVDVANRSIERQSYNDG